MKNLQFELIEPLEHREKVLGLIEQLNPKMDLNTIEERLINMTQVPNYICFALFENSNLIGISSGWTTIRIYCGKQLELDNVIIDSKIQSKGFGKYFINEIKKWSLANDYQSIGLNTYVENARSHKFYFNQNFKILGFHFEHNLNQE
ncbi:GNAT family N-acetyltransferase [Arenibacter sp. F20364]|uniref:GNAT family N-acetyltransferase n=1 Tax=Arenibacter sp. F20364 TaxID=2926415 RepID=UPI001FF394FE|nr:GNAT family N-acetyltransferase [Arenibacter sp. F20364]MCK0192516.1 GNAT family N-acetyltransferase [Arenibacter sp. F20364]